MEKLYIFFKSKISLCSRKTSSVKAIINKVFITFFKEPGIKRSRNKLEVVEVPDPNLMMVVADPLMIGALPNLKEVEVVSPRFPSVLLLFSLSLLFHSFAAVVAFIYVAVETRVVAVPNPLLVERMLKVVLAIPHMDTIKVAAVVVADEPDLVASWEAWVVLLLLQA